jgi:hypothetical protein
MGRLVRVHEPLGMLGIGQVVEVGQMHAVGLL